MKTLLIATIVLVLAVVLLALIGKDIITKAVLKNGIEARTGAKLVIGSVDVRLLAASAKIDNLILLNPPGYEDTVMAEIPELFLDCNPRALLLGKIHFQKVRLNLKRLFIVKNMEGGLNVYALKGMRSKPEVGIRQAAPIKEEAKAKRGSFKIDRLELKLGKVIYKDYTVGAPIGVIELSLNIDESYEDITSPDDVVKVVLARALVGTAIAKIANIDLGHIRSGAAETLERGVKEIKGAAEKAAEMLKEKLKSTLGD